MSAPARPLRRVNVAGILTMVTLGLAWELTVRTRWSELEFLPAPTAIARALIELIASGVLLERTVHTLGIALGGWVAACSIGLALGVLLGLSDAAHRYSITSVEVLRAIPPITFIPAALLVLGFSPRMELVIVVYAGVWPLLITTIGGVRGVPLPLLDVARMLQMSTATMVRRIILPAALPSIVVGARLALSLCLVLAVVAEMIGNPAGLGNGLIRARSGLQPARMFAYVLTIGLLGVALNAALRGAVAILLPAPAVDADRWSAW